MGNLQVTGACGYKRLVYSNHFALAIYVLELIKLTYADTLGWGMPETVRTIFPKV